jgi:hypothetical protein
MTTSARETTLTQDIGSYLRHQLRGWRGLVAAAVVLAAPALWFGWPWLVAAGLAPLLLAMAPCAVMCALGLCMGRAGKKPESAPIASGEAPGSALHRVAAGAESESPKSLGGCCAKEDRAVGDPGAALIGGKIPTRVREITDDKTD